MNAKENFLETLTWGNPQALVNEWEPFSLVPDPLMAMTLIAKPGERLVDPWGVTIYLGEDEPGAMPIITDELKAIKDITQWQSDIKSPDIMGANLDWTEALSIQEAVRADDKLSMTLMATGLFEQSHYLMGFEDALVNLLIEPEAMHGLLDYITDYRLNYCKLIVQNLKPDVVLLHDDWGSKDNLFMSADTWREFFKPRYQKIYSYLKENGIIIIHHADSVCDSITQDMIDLGIDVWQGVLPQNDMTKVQEIAKDKMLLMGGIDAQKIDFKDFDEEAIRAEVRRACNAYAPAGGFIPCLTYGAPGSIFPGVDDIIQDEINALSSRYF